MDDLVSDSSGEEFDGYIDDNDIDEEVMRRCSTCTAGRFAFGH